MLPTVIGQTDLGISTLDGTGFFIVVHIALLLVGAFFAYRAFTAGPGASKFAWAFTLFVLAEVSYLLYHFNTTTFLLSHTVSEVLDAAAFVLVFVGVTEHVIGARRAAAAGA